MSPERPPDDAPPEPAPSPPRSLIAAAALLVGATIGYLLAGGATPASSHIIFVPSVALLGIVVGFVLGGRAARDAIAGQHRAATARAARRVARQPPADGG